MTNRFAESADSKKGRESLLDLSPLYWIIVETVVSVSPLLRVRLDTRSGVTAGEILSRGCWFVGYGCILPLSLQVCSSRFVLLIHP